MRLLVVRRPWLPEDTVELLTYRSAINSVSGRRRARDAAHIESCALVLPSSNGGAVDGLYELSHVTPSANAFSRALQERWSSSAGCASPSRRVASGRSTRTSGACRGGVLADEVTAGGGDDEPKLRVALRAVLHVGSKRCAAGGV